MIKNGIKLLSFALVCLLVLGAVSNVLRFKHEEGTEPMQMFYHQPTNTVDVLCLGSSHAYNAINTGLLWDSWGIASYDLCGSNQPVWNTYYYLKEALVYQRPCVIVLDVYMVLEKQAVDSSPTIINNTFGIKGAENKLAAKQASSQKSELLEYALEFPYYHSRYSDLSREDFLPYKGIKDRSMWKGFVINPTTSSLAEEIDVAGVTTRVSLPEKSEEYLYRIIELCKDNAIPLVLYCSPYALTDVEQQGFNTIADIAKEEDVPFLNYNLLHNETGIDFSGPESCLTNDTGHLNHRGCVKLTNHLGGWLKEKYDIPDRRGDEAYLSWQISADNTRAQIEGIYITEKQSFSEWVEAVCSYDRLTAVFAFDRGFMSSLPGGSEEKVLSCVGVDSEDIDDGAVLVLKGGDREFFSNNPDCQWYEKTDAGTLMVERGSGNSVIEYGNDYYHTRENGVTVVLYDEQTGKIVESSWWGAASCETKNLYDATK